MHFFLGSQKSGAQGVKAINGSNRLIDHPTRLRVIQVGFRTNRLTRLQK